MTLFTDDRGAATTVTHALAIGISSALVLTLLLGLGGFLDSQEKEAADRQLATIGERVGTELSKAHSFAVDDGNAATLRVSHPERVAGHSYRISVEDEDGRCASDRICVFVGPTGSGPGAERTVELKLHADAVVENDVQAVSGGDFTIAVEWDGTNYVVRLSQ